MQADAVAQIDDEVGRAVVDRSDGKGSKAVAIDRVCKTLSGEMATNSTPGRESCPVACPDFKSGWGSEAALGGFDSHSLPPSGDRS
ncbi:hypothetical protein CDO30_21825 (plasmid) [Sinorhizobium meliloti]|nr:hypothetical protein CDO30_21825 [Sinorhizobium meliloti]